ncbi:MAG: hypothetical protein J3R72DRAFT_492345 [Linnemannia gamsii]|nr:MAG: hypothetical protein J3R72DRAFT_492345 [Linnemannia gamsii]
MAAISVNRLFHSVLTPLLWTVYYEPNEKMIDLAEIRNYQEYRGLYTHVDIDTVEKNSIFLRCLDVSAYSILPRMRSAGHLQLQCQHHQELRVSPDVGVAWVSRLIKLSPNLQVLDWRRASRASEPLPLRRLRHLSLQGWNLQSLFLRHVLENNANCLEEIDLVTYVCHINDPPMNDDWSGLKDSSVAKMTTHQANRAAKLIRGQRLLLPKVKTLHVNHNPYRNYDLFHSLVCVLPALETLVVEKMDEDDAVGLSQSLQEHCPHLRAIKHPKLHQNLRFRSVRCTNSTMMPVDACIPGNLMHLSLDLDLSDTYVKDTILKQTGRGLEVLELVLRGRNTIDASFVNLSRILEQSKRLKRVWIRNGDYDPFHIFRSITSEFLKGLRCCQELESLTMIGFFGTEEEDGAVDRENVEQAESEQQQ